MLTHEDVEEILRLLDATPVEELELQTEHFKLTLRRSLADRSGWTQERQTGTAPNVLAAPSSTTAAAATSTAAATAAPSLNAPEPGASMRNAALEVRAPLVGTFYRAPKPGAAPFVEVGTLVSPDTVVAIIETMKLMNSVHAGAAGRVLEVCIEDGGFVEQHQLLMRLAPPE
jgi:acetyl-CoA carboxylase biotin carboxyl carrier protein